MLDNLSTPLTCVQNHCGATPAYGRQYPGGLEGSQALRCSRPTSRYPSSKDFIAGVKGKGLLAREVISSLTPGQALVGVVNARLTALMGRTKRARSCRPAPAVILMAGLAGCGQDDDDGQARKLLRERMKKKVLAVSTDVIGPPRSRSCNCGRTGGDRFSPLTWRRSRWILPKRRWITRVVITSMCCWSIPGRLAIDEIAMAEIKDLHAGINPIETLFVVDAMQGRTRSIRRGPSTRRCR